MSAFTDQQALSLIAALDALDGDIETFQASKREHLNEARESMEGLTKGEIAKHIGAVKKAVAKLRKQRSKPEAADLDEERDALAEHYIELASRAPRATRVHVREADEIAPRQEELAGHPAPFERPASNPENGHVDCSAGARPGNEALDVEATPDVQPGQDADLCNSSTLSMPSGVSAGSDVRAVAPIPPERAQRLAEHISDRQANRPPLDPKSNLFPILFKARYGRDPEPADYGEAS